MKPLRLSPNALQMIPNVTDARKILRAYTKYACTQDERKAIIKRATELSIELPVTDVTYI